MATHRYSLIRCVIDNFADCALLQCVNGVGACPDEVDLTGSCTNDILSVSGSKEGGQQCVIYTRSFATSKSPS